MTVCIIPKAPEDPEVAIPHHTSRSRALHTLWPYELKKILSLSVSPPPQVSARVSAGVRLVRQMERAEALAQRVDAQALILYSLEAELDAQVTAILLSWKQCHSTAA